MRNPSPPRLLAALDLDRTLIYSVRSLERFGGPPDRDLVSIERHQGDTVSYADPRLDPLLAELATRALVVPTTARTAEQYARVQLPQAIAAGYAVCANGGQILANGVPDPDWTASIAAEIATTGLTTAMAAEWLAGIGQAVSKVRTAGELFSYAVLDLEPDVAAQALDLHDIRQRLGRHGWRLGFSGRKLYALPPAIDKARALAHLRDRLGSPTLFAAGDSQLDATMLELADTSLCPAHGDADARQAASSITTATGPTAAIEIVQHAFRLAGKPARSELFDGLATLAPMTGAAASPLLPSAATGARSGPLEGRE